MIARSRAVRVFATAAMTGLLAGATSMVAGCQGSNSNPPSSAGVSSDSGNAATASAKHDCAGKNSCKGQGGCASSDNGCKGKNSCKGKGGCSTV